MNSTPDLKLATKLGGTQRFTVECNPTIKFKTFRHGQFLPVATRKKTIKTTTKTVTETIIRKRKSVKKKSYLNKIIRRKKPVTVVNKEKQNRNLYFQLMHKHLRPGQTSIEYLQDTNMEVRGTNHTLLKGSGKQQKGTETVPR